MEKKKPRLSRKQKSGVTITKTFPSSKALAIEHTMVVSDMISSIGYNRSKEILEVLFSNNKLHKYKAVPHNIYMSFMTAPTYNTFYNEYVKDQFDFEVI
ncbi:MAG: hypothetical protein JWN76_2970 [Chitinophagaceae bacterium]|nr:hypothetical protein [Chitinophagaceae bacterium]